MYSEVISKVSSWTDIDKTTLLLSEANDVIIPSSGETQIDIATASCVIESGIALGGDLNILKTKQNGVFLSYYLNNARKKNIARLAQGNSIVHLYASQLSSLKLNLPSLPEQAKIADFLTLVDKRISLLQKKKESLEQYKKGMMQKIFSQQLRFKDENGNDFPDWEEKRLGDYLIKHEDKTIKNNQYPVLTSSQKGIFLQSDYFSNQVASKDNTGYNVVPRNYFTYRHMSDTVVFKFNINNIVDKGIVSTLYPVFTTHGLDNYFLLILLNEGNEFKRFAIQQKQGGSRTYMYFSKLVNLKLNLPSLPEQQKIASFLSAVDKSIKNVSSQVEQMRNWKKGLLQRMFV